MCNSWFLAHNCFTEQRRSTECKWFNCGVQEQEYIIFLVHKTCLQVQTWNRDNKTPIKNGLPQDLKSKRWLWVVWESGTPTRELPSGVWLGPGNLTWATKEWKNNRPIQKKVGSGGLFSLWCGAVSMQTGNSVYLLCFAQEGGLASLHGKSL